MRALIVLRYTVFPATCSTQCCLEVAHLHMNRQSCCPAVLRAAAVSSTSDLEVMGQSTFSFQSRIYRSVLILLLVFPKAFCVYCGTVERHCYAINIVHVLAVGIQCSFLVYWMFVEKIREAFSSYGVGYRDLGWNEVGI